VTRVLGLHAAVLLALLAGLWALPEYHQGNVARIMVLAVFALGYNLAFGYTGLLSLGHAMFFAVGMYAAGLGAELGGWAAWQGLVAGPLAGGALAFAVGLLALRTVGVSFMIVTLMFSQAAYLLTAYRGEITRADEGFVLDSEARRLAGLDLGSPDVRYAAAWLLFAVCLALALWLVRSRTGRLMVAVRENEPRARMLGHDTFRVRLLALVVSGAMSGAAGAAYGLLFGYVGNTFASIQYSILPLLWVLLGGAGTTLGPLVGVAVLFYLIDVASSVTEAHLIVVGAALVALVLFAPTGLLGALRRRAFPWLP